MESTTSLQKKDLKPHNATLNATMETSCVRCGAEMSPFVWGIKRVDTCSNCGFKHPCCE